MLYFFNNISLFFSFLGCILPVSDLLFVVNFLICTDNVFSLQRFHFHYVVFIVLFSMPLIVLVSQDYQFTIWWVFSLLLLCMFISVLFVSICKVLIFVVAADESAQWNGSGQMVAIACSGAQKDLNVVGLKRNLTLHMASGAFPG